MDKSQLIAALRDIHIPKPIGLWPVALGWYLVLALVLIGILYATRWLIRKLDSGRFKREALQRLHNLQTGDGETAWVAGQISALLRRLALVYYPRADIAGLQNAAWIAFLNQTGKDSDFTAIADVLVCYPFLPHPPPIDLEPVFRAAKKWIKQRKKPCLI